MTLDPRTPVLVGASAVSQPLADPGERAEAAELMIRAARLAAGEVGGKLIDRLDLVAAMASTTPYRDPARLVADDLGATAAQTIVAEPGILQQQVLSGACREVMAGHRDVVMLVAGEAKYRAQQAEIHGIEIPDTVQADDVEPDQRLTAEGMVIHRCEIDAGLIQAVHHYAMIENAIGAARGLTPAEQSAEVAELWARFSKVAVANPDAWNRTPVASAEIATSGPANRMLATPYTKLHNSQWNVDQAVALIITTVGTAQEMGVPRDGLVFPLGAAESNHMVPLVERSEPGRCQGFQVVGETLAHITGIGAGDADYLELYSCFPAAVRLQLSELGIDPSRELTVTGGMTFGGGPFNHFVLQALAKLVEVLREDEDSTGLITSVSGMVTKQAGSIWSTRPPPTLPEFRDVSAAARAATPVRRVAPGYDGAVEVVTSTVLWSREGPETAAAVVESPDGGRLLATSNAPDVVAAFADNPRIGEAAEATALAADSAHARLALPQR